MISISQKGKEIYQVPKSKHGLEACHPQPLLEDLIVLVSSGQFLLYILPSLLFWGSVFKRWGSVIRRSSG